MLIGIRWCGEDKEAEEVQDVADREPLLLLPPPLLPPLLLVQLLLLIVPDD